MVQNELCDNKNAEETSPVSDEDGAPRPKRAKVESIFKDTASVKLAGIQRRLKSKSEKTAFREAKGDALEVLECMEGKDSALHHIARSWCYMALYTGTWYKYKQDILSMLQSQVNDDTVHTEVYQMMEQDTQPSTPVLVKWVNALQEMQCDTQKELNRYLFR